MVLGPHLDTTVIRKLLVANRGEIARRIFRTCRELGIGTVAVFSPPDAGSPHVAEADEAIALAGPAPAESYLEMGAIISAAVRVGADAVHPGYGFLAENPEFARSVIEAGLTWVGPSPEAITAMGSKLRAKRLMIEAGVPTLPSTDLTGLDAEAVEKAAAELGYPVLVKASAGGGGKGMRIVRDPTELVEAVAGAGREAEAAFGDPTLLLEAYVEPARHVEIQVLADSHGNVASLFERDCSVQRRHQKLIEEAPSPAVDDATRARIGEAAVAAARRVGYVGAGTVEFLYREGTFWFLEMNTRLQVEHPVTEEITGLDLVALQLAVAGGGPLPEEVMEPAMVGHAVEARVYGEDPRHDFLPATGRFERFRIPPIRGVRVESGVEDGTELSGHYDPMVAKVIAWADSRSAACALLASALQRAEIHGPTTNRDLLVRILRHPEFLAGDADIGFLERHSPAELGRPLPSPEEEEMAAVAAALCAQEARRRDRPSPIPTGFRNNPSQPQTVVFEGEGGEIRVGYRFGRRRGMTVEVNGSPLEPFLVRDPSPERIGLDVSGHLRWFGVHRVGAIHHVDGPSGYSRLVERPRFPALEPDEEPGSLGAPMPGKVVRLLVGAGDRVEEGQVLLVMEAMKMEHSLRAPHPGRVAVVRAGPGEQVEAGQVLVVLET